MSSEATRNRDIDERLDLDERRDYRAARESGRIAAWLERESARICKRLRQAGCVEGMTELRDEWADPGPDQSIDWVVGEKLAEALHKMGL